MDRPVTFLSKDKKKFVCPFNVAIMSTTIKNIIEDSVDDENNNIISLENIWYDDIETIFNFLETRMYQENSFELSNDTLYIFNNPCIPIMINYVNFLDIEPLLDLLASIFAYKLEGSYNDIVKESDTIKEMRFNLFYKLPDEMIFYCLKKIKTNILFKLCMLNNSFWYFMKMIPDTTFNFIDCDSESVSVFLNHIKTLNDDSITNFVINIFTNGLSIDINTELMKANRSLFFDFLMECPLFLESINFNQYRKEFTQLVLVLFNCNDPVKFEKICKSTFNPDSLEGFNFNLYCTIILEENDKSFLEIIKTYIQMLNNTFKHDIFEEIDYQCLHECSLITGHYDLVLFAHENGAKFTEYDEDFDNEFASTFTPGSISYAIVGNNIDCVKYTIDAFKKINNGLLLSEWMNYIKWTSSHGTLEILEYLINNIDGIQDIFDNFYGYILEWALTNGNIEIVQYALDNGAIFTDDMHTRIIEYNIKRPLKYDIDDEDHTDFNYYTLSFDDQNKDNIEKCMAIIHSHNNTNQ